MDTLTRPQVDAADGLENGRTITAEEAAMAHEYVTTGEGRPMSMEAVRDVHSWLQERRAARMA